MYINSDYLVGGAHLIAQTLNDPQLVHQVPLGLIAKHVMPSGFSALESKPEIPTWLVGSDAELAAFDRSLLSRYNSLLKMVIDSTGDGQLAGNVYKEYYSLFPKVSHLLPCWAVTALSAKGRIPFEPGYFDLVVFDEASQCDIASAMPLLYRAKRAVIIGDPKQLSHISGMMRGQDTQLLEKFNLLKDYVQWSYSSNSLFDLASGIVDGNYIVSLRDHHRSHADIIEFSNREFYEGNLRVATRYNKLCRPMPVAPGIA